MRSLNGLQPSTNGLPFLCIPSCKRYTMPGSLQLTCMLVYVHICPRYEQARIISESCIINDCPWKAFLLTTPKIPEEGFLFSPASQYSWHFLPIILDCPGFHLSLLAWSIDTLIGNIAQDLYVWLFFLAAFQQRPTPQWRGGMQYNKNI